MTRYTSKKWENSITLADKYIFQFLFSDGNSNDDESSNGETTKGLGVYAQNIDLHLHAADGASGETPGKIHNFNVLEVLFLTFHVDF